jgi:hypothetical protein
MSHTPVLHAGICVQTGLVIVPQKIMGKARACTMDGPLSPEEVARRKQRCTDLLGEPFERLPGNTGSALDHRILAELSDGSKVPGHVIEMVFNDARTVDFICGEGHYEQVMPELEREILSIARNLYAQGVSVQ